MSAPLRVGTRASLLATTQSRWVAHQLGVPVELVEVNTEGDVNRGPLAQIGGTGVFVSALRDALLRDEVDVAVHSLKDLPTAAADGIVCAAIPLREDPRDALVARNGLTLGELPPRSTIGTGSPRRTAQLNALGLVLTFLPIRGNVDTRLGKVASGEVDAVVLARAGLSRLGLLGEVTEMLDPLQMLPAPGQGALAVECRADVPHLVEQVALTLDDLATRSAVEAERSLLATFEAGCSAPVGALGEVVDGDDGVELWLRAVVVHPSGYPLIRQSATGRLDDAFEVGRDLAHQMLADGADSIVKEPVT
ncbi:MAG: hydroxymethylbilane synthase [Nocardioidaceae bacterium]